MALWFPSPLPKLVTSFQSGSKMSCIPHYPSGFLLRQTERSSLGQPGSSLRVIGGPVSAAAPVT